MEDTFERAIANVPLQPDKRSTLHLFLRDITPLFFQRICCCQLSYCLALDDSNICFILVVFLLSPLYLFRYWRRYIYLWINYFLYEELEMNDVEKTREIYKTCLQIIPHKTFTFAKIWIMFAHFEIRQLELQSARKIMVNCVELANSVLFLTFFVCSVGAV